MVTALGIDLGTTYSVVATVDGHGRPVVLRNPLGKETTPSVVCFESATSVLVGATARAAAPVLPRQTVALVKRQMGTDRVFSFHGREHTPESVSALILRALVDGALPGRRAGAPVPAVVTVPAYFGVREREATQQACLMADLEVLELIAEPAAAAVHYGFAGAPDGWSAGAPGWSTGTPGWSAGAPGGGSAGGGSVVAYDLGGGTFDATLLTLGERIQVVATDGDTELGGADWDRRLVTYLAERFAELAGPGADPADDEGFMAELALTAEQVKQDLSMTTAQRVPVRHGGRTATVLVTREEFEAMTADLVDTTLGCLRRLLATARRAGAGDVDQCLLVGGSSRMPMIASALRAEFGWRPRLYDPDLAVAKGAALRAYQILRSRTRSSAAILAPTWASTPAVPAAPEPVSSVVPRSFGLLVHDSYDPDGRRRYIDHVIHQNEPLPVAGREVTVATILDDQARVHIEVYEQAGAVASAEVEYNRRVLDGELSGLPAPLPAGSPIRIRLSLGMDGRLSLAAVEPRSGTTLEVEACIDGVVDGPARTRMGQGLALLTVRQ